MSARALRAAASRPAGPARRALRHRATGKFVAAPPAARGSPAATGCASRHCDNGCRPNPNEEGCPCTMPPGGRVYCPAKNKCANPACGPGRRFDYETCRCEADNVCPNGSPDFCSGTDDDYEPYRCGPDSDPRRCVCVRSTSGATHCVYAGWTLLPCAVDADCDCLWPPIRDDLQSLHQSLLPQVRGVKAAVRGLRIARSLATRGRDTGQLSAVPASSRGSERAARTRCARRRRPRVPGRPVTVARTAVPTLARGRRRRTGNAIDKGARVLPRCRSRFARARPTAQ